MNYSTPERGVSRWVLDHRKPRKKHECPKCHAKKHFTRYVDAVTGQEAGDIYGICDNTIKCGYKMYPTSDLLPGGTSVLVDSKDMMSEFLFDREDDYASCIPPERVLEYMKNYESNKLYQYLITLFDEHRVMSAMWKYRIGTMDYYSWKGCMIFWQIDRDYVVRTGKIMEYNSSTGKRVKGNDSSDGTPHVTFFHCREYPDYNLQQCLFGEHLLNEYPTNLEVNIVEAEKTALACSIKNPKKIYLSVGGIQNIRERTMRVLADRRIVFHPDKGKAYNTWKKKVEDQLIGYDTHISSFLEKTDLDEGQDLADYIFREQLKNKKT